MIDSFISLTPARETILLEGVILGQVDSNTRGFRDYVREFERVRCHNSLCPVFLDYLETSFKESKKPRRRFGKILLRSVFNIYVEGVFLREEGMPSVEDHPFKPIMMQAMGFIKIKKKSTECTVHQYKYTHSRIIILIFSVIYLFFTNKFFFLSIRIYRDNSEKQIFVGLCAAI